MPSFQIPDGPATIELKRSGPGAAATGTVVFNVTNTSGRVCDGRLTVVPSGNAKADWFAIEGNRERSFTAGETQTATIRVTAPTDAAPGDYPFRLRAVAVDDPDNDHAEGPMTTAKVPPAVTAPAPKRPPYWLWILIALLVLAAIATAAYFAFRSKPDTAGPAATSGAYATFLAGNAQFSDGGSGPMWAGSGPRNRIVHVDFAKPFERPPTVVVGISSLDAASNSASSVRISASVQNVTERGFDVNFHTWADSRIWSTSVMWVAYKP